MNEEGTAVLRRWGFSVTPGQRPGVDALVGRYGLEALEDAARRTAMSGSRSASYLIELMVRRNGVWEKSAIEKSPAMTTAAAATPRSQPESCDQAARTAAATRRSPSLAAATTASMSSESSAATIGASQRDGGPWWPSPRRSRVAAIWAGSMGVGLAVMGVLLGRIGRGDSNRADERVELPE